MNAKLIARVARIEALFPPVARRWDMSGLTVDELQIIESLPSTEAKLCAVIDAPGYDFIRLARIVDKLERGQ